MSMYNYLSAFGISLVTFFLADMLWLGVVAKDLYRKHLGHLMSDNVNWAAAIAFYLLFLLALQFFSVAPALKSANATPAWLSGAVLGFICYATYDLTNLATLRSWPLSLSVIDIIWGTVLSGLTAGITFKLMKLWFV